MDCASLVLSFRASQRTISCITTNVAKHRSGSAKGCDGRCSIISKCEDSHSTSVSGSTILCQDPGFPPYGYRVFSRRTLLQITRRPNAGLYGSVDNRSANLSEIERGSFFPDIPAIRPSHLPTNRPSGLTI